MQKFKIKMKAIRNIMAIKDKDILLFIECFLRGVDSHE